MKKRDRIIELGNELLPLTLQIKALQAKCEIIRNKIVAEFEKANNHIIKTNDFKIEYREPTQYYSFDKSLLNELFDSLEDSGIKRVDYMAKKTRKGGIVFSPAVTSHKITQEQYLYFKRKAESKNESESDNPDWYQF